MRRVVLVIPKIVSVVLYVLRGAIVNRTKYCS